MKIIIAGAGRIGSSLAEMLSQEGHDITVIDRDEETISHVSNDIDVICLEGNATNPDVLTEAGAKHELLDFPKSTERKLGHVFSVTYPMYPESREVFEKMDVYVREVL